MDGRLPDSIHWDHEKTVKKNFLLVLIENFDTERNKSEEVRWRERDGEREREREREREIEREWTVCFKREMWRHLFDVCLRVRACTVWFRLSLFLLKLLALLIFIIFFLVATSLFVQLPK